MRELEQLSQDGKHNTDPLPAFNKRVSERSQSVKSLRSDGNSFHIPRGSTSERSSGLARTMSRRSSLSHKTKHRQTPAYQIWDKTTALNFDHNLMLGASRTSLNSLVHGVVQHETRFNMNRGKSQHHRRIARTVRRSVRRHGSLQSNGLSGSPAVRSGAETSSDMSVVAGRIDNGAA